MLVDNDNNTFSIKPTYSFKKENMEHLKSMMITWGMAFLIGSGVGLYFGQNRVYESIKKDCDIMFTFRVGAEPYNCKPKV